MATNAKQWWSIPSRILHSWYTPAFLIVVLIAAVLIWAMPRRIDQVTSADTDLSWSTGEAPPVRKVLWEPSQPLSGLLPDSNPGDSFVTPRLTDAGATLYFTRRTTDGQADIYRARLEFGQWQPAEPVTELNSAGEDFCSSLSADGRTIYFYSNRAGGHGGFDIYVSQRDDTGWSEPKNLGPTVNSLLDEYDPAVSPDGLTLIFSSDRRPEMLELARKKEKIWPGTLRTHSGLRQFDLYVSRKAVVDKPWPVPQAITELNTPTSNEGAPYFSPYGSYLYFASDRPNPHGDTPNKDLYRARFIDGLFQELENLGPGVNTGSNELEPALSPEGYTLVYSSDRDGTYRIYTSKAQEVFESSEWDTARWSIVVSLWWKVLVVLLVLALVAFLLWYFRNWLFERATASRFIVASLLLHLLIVCILALIPLASEVIDQVRMVEARVSAIEVFSNVNADGPPAHATVADLPALDEAVEPALDRQAVTATEPVPEKAVTMARLDVPVTVVLVPLPEAAATIPDSKPSQPAPTPALQKKIRLDQLQIARATPIQFEPVPVVENPIPQQIDAGTVDVGRKTNSNDPDTQQPPPNPIPNTSPDTGPQAPIRPVTGNPTPHQESMQIPLPTRMDSKMVLQLARLNDTRLNITPIQPVPPKELDPVGASVALNKSDSGPSDPAKPVAPNRPTQVEPQKISKLDPSSLSRNPAPNIPAIAIPKKLLPLDKATPMIAKSELDLPKIDAKDLSSEQIPNLPESPVVGVTVSVPKSSNLNFGMQMIAKKDSKYPEIPGFGSPALKTIKKKSLLDKPALAFENNTDKPLPRQLAKATRLGQLDEDRTARLILAARDPETKRETAAIFGGTRESEDAVERGLKWLAKVQSKDGSWSLHKYQGTQADTAGTALGLLPFLGAGYTHKNGKYQTTVDKAVRWLVKHQQSNGDLFKRQNDHHQMYSHGLAAIALCETYALSQDPALREPAQKAVNFIVWAQHDGGGWRYRPKERGDTSVFGWQVMALKSAQMAGLDVPQVTLDRSLVFLDSVAGKGKAFGTFDYQPGTARLAMTAQGLLSSQLLGASRDDPRMIAGAEHLLKYLPRPGKETSYYYYHANQVMYHLQGKYWKTWNEKLRDMNIKEQVKNGDHAGSWNPQDDRERTGGRIFATSLRLLMLEVYYRHLPLYKQLEK
jgi:hypothetical protein